MAEHVSPVLQIMRDELAVQRERRDADRVETAHLMADGKLALKRGRALVSVPVSPSTSIGLPSLLPAPAPRPETVASRMSVGAWSWSPSSFGEPHA
jgi:hypothetical protein